MNKKYCFVNILLLLSVTISFLTGCSPVAPESVDYLQMNKKEINLFSNTVEGIDILDKYSSYCKMVFTGEYHGVKCNYMLAFKFLTYLNSSAGYTWFLTESGVSNVYYINQYLESGNEEFLDMVMNAMKGTFSGTLEKREFYKRIREYNLGRSPEKRVKIMGIDIEHQYDLSFRYIHENLQNKNFPEKMVGPFSTFEKKYIEKSPASVLFTCLKDIDSVICLDTLAAKELFGSSWLNIRLIVDNALFLLQWNGSANRDFQILKTFKKLYTSLGSTEVKFYGHWGSAHIPLFSCEGEKRIVQLINESDDLPFKNSILSIPVFYHDCWNFDRKTLQESPISGFDRLLGPLIKAAESDFTLFNLTADQTPYRVGLNFVEDASGGGSTVDYFQMCILAQHWRAQTPLR